MMRKLLIAVALLAVMMTAKALPADSVYNAEAVDLNAVVVTGTRTPRTLSDAPVITRVIPESEIRKLDVSSVSDLLTSVLPGVEFTYSMNQQVSFNMQGFSGTSVLFLIDGERMAGETLDNVDYSRLNLDNVERIEIVRGAASSLYGSNAVGGVINIITRQQKKPWTLKAGTKYGRHHAWENSLTWGLHRGRWRNTLSIHHQNIHTFTVPAGDFSTVYGGHSWNIKDQLSYDVNDRLRLTGRYGYFFRQRDYTQADKYRYRDFDGSVKADWRLGDRTTLEVSYHYDQYDKSDYYPLKDKDIRDYSNVQNTLRALLNHAFTPDMTLTVGLDGMTDYLMSYQFDGNGSHTQYDGDVFGQFDWNISPRVNLLAGLRADWFSGIGAHVSPRVSLKYKPVRGLSLRAGYANGFRAPTLKERYMRFDMAGLFTIYGEENLQPENSHNINLSAEYLRHRYSLTVSAYHNRVSDRISTLWSTASGGMQYLNTGKVNISGLDAAFDYRLDFGLNTKIAYAWTHESTDKSRTYIMSARPHSATFSADYGKQAGRYAFNVMLSGRWLSSLHTNVLSASSGYQEFTAADYPAYSMWKLVFSQHWDRWLHVALTIDNLLNYRPEYYYNNSPVTTGTAVAVSVSMDIDRLLK